ncbi:MAG: class D sortase [Acidithiobacillales bacterium]
MKPLRVLEGALIAVGVALLAFWGFMRLHRAVGERADLSRFAEAREAARGAPAAETPVVETRPAVDTSLWAPERVRAYEESLRKKFGAPLGILSIPKIRLEVPVLEGTDDLTLNRAVGRIEGTARPGEAGNLGIAGHRDGFFRGLMDVAVGDEIRLSTLTRSYVYVIESIRIVAPEDVQVLDPTPQPVLTLVSCYPFYFVGSAPRRFIVRAVLVGESPVAGSRAEAPPAIPRKEATSARNP